MRTAPCIRLTALACCLLLSSAVTAADAGGADTSAMEDACRKAAAVDGVTPREMDDYMADCLSEAMQNLDDADPGARATGHPGDDAQDPEGDQEPAPVD